MCEIFDEFLLSKVGEYRKENPCGKNIRWEKVAAKYNYEMFGTGHRFQIGQKKLQARFTKIKRNPKLVDPNQTDFNGDTPLMRAVRKNDLEWATLLLIRPRIEVNLQKRGCTALYMACEFGRVDIARKILSTPGTDVTLRKPGGYTPLWVACARNRRGIVQLLLATKNVLINQGNGNGATPLWVACKNGYNLTAKVLLSAGDIQVNQPNHKGQTPLWIACENNRLATVQLLLATKDVLINQGDENGVTPLWIACKKAHRNIVKVLTSATNIDVNQPSHKGQTPLWLACDSEEDTIVEELLTTPNIDVNRGANDGSTPLTCLISDALHSSSGRTIDLLLAAEGIDVNHPDDGPPLWLACHSDRCHSLVKRLLRKGAEVNKSNNKGLTPLMQACKSGSSRIVQTLLKRDDIVANNTDLLGETPLHIACLSGYEKVVQLLLQYNPEQPSKRISVNKENLLLQTAMDMVCFRSDLNVEQKKNRKRIKRIAALLWRAGGRRGMPRIVREELQKRATLRQYVHMTIGKKVKGNGSGAVSDLIANMIHGNMVPEPHYKLKF